VSRKNTYTGGDSRTLAARAQGYPARSIFKLEEIDQRCKLLKPGQRVVDLGAAPGSWSLYAARCIGERGHLLAIDLQAITQAFPAWVTVLQGDALDVTGDVHRAHSPYDVVLSDMAPKTSGDKFSNAARSYDLFSAALAVAENFGKPGSAFVGKLFMGQDFEAARAKLGKMFTATRVVKPSGTRDNSVEVFLVGLGRRAQSAPRTEP
jgi:23S rRNA (uridine2552-2'-O)-methyltransferase